MDDFTTGDRRNLKTFGYKTSNKRRNTKEARERETKMARRFEQKTGILDKQAKADLLNE